MRTRDFLSGSVGLLVMALTLNACSDTPSGPDVESPESPLKSVTRVQISGFVAAPNAMNGSTWFGSVPGFTSPLDGVASPDGSVFYFTGFTDEPTPQAAIYRVSSTGGEATLLHAGGPLAYPASLLLSCDGSTLYVGDRVMDGDDRFATDAGGLYRLSANGGVLTRMDDDGIVRPSALAMDNDCSTLVVGGREASGAPNLFRKPVGGAASVPLTSASAVFSGGIDTAKGLYVDGEGTTWVTVLKGLFPDATAQLYAVNSSTSSLVTSVVLSSGAVSLGPDRTFAVVPTRGPAGGARLQSINLTTGSETAFPTPQIASAGGLRVARSAPVMILVDRGGDAIYRVE